MTTPEHSSPDSEPDDVNLVQQLETAVADSYRNGYEDGLSDGRSSELRLHGNPFARSTDTAPAATTSENAGCFVHTRRNADNVFPPVPPVTLVVAAYALWLVDDSTAHQWFMLTVAGWLVAAWVARLTIRIAARGATSTDDKRDDA